MDMNFLEELGLTKSEIKVYLSLLEIGESSTGKIVDKAKVSSSKIYEIMDKLIQKGLVSYIIKSGVKYFESAQPNRLLDYISEKEKKLEIQKEKIKKILPELELKKKLSNYKSQATIYKGYKGLETAFFESLDLLKANEELLVIGIPNRSEISNRFFVKFAKERQRRKIKSRATINEIARGELQTLKKNLYSLKLKYIQQTMPAAINIFKDRIIIFPEEKDEIILFVIDNKEIAEGFRVQFELLWNQDVSTYHGHNAVESIYDSIIENTNKKNEILIYASKPNDKRSSEYNIEWQKKIAKKAKNVKLLYYGQNEINNERLKKVNQTGCISKIYPTSQNLPISTIITKNEVINTIWSNKPTAIKIENKIVANSLKENFNILWNQNTFVVKGIKAIENIFMDMLNYKQIDFIGARGYLIDKSPKFISKWEKLAIEKGFKMRNIVDKEIKGHKITRFPFAKTKYTIPKEYAKLSVIWIYGNKIAISNWTKKEPFAIIINNKEIYDMYKSQFEIIWNMKKFK